MTSTQGMTDDDDAHSEYQRAVAASGTAIDEFFTRLTARFEDWTLTVVLARE
jgi:hypothetical protein